MDRQKEGKRCRWVNLKNPLYVKYHDEEWGKPLHDDKALYELLILESFQAGLSWECILNKRENFRKAYDGFDIDRVAAYDESKIEELLEDPGIIRNRRKVNASINNSRIFKRIQEEFGSFDEYLWGFTDHQIIYESFETATTSPLSDRISGDLKKRGMKFVGSTIIYSYLQSAGIIYAHSEECCLHQIKK